MVQAVILREKPNEKHGNKIFSYEALALKVYRVRVHLIEIQLNYWNTFLLKFEEI